MGQGPIRRLARWFTTPWGLATLFAIALALRLLIAPVTGDEFDLQVFRRWSIRLAKVGPGAFYDGYAADPPGYLLVLWPIGELGRLFGRAAPDLVLQLPAILADLGLAWVAAELAVRVTPDTTVRPEAVRATVAAAVLFNPAILFLSSVRGQIDTVGCFLLISALIVLFTRSIWFWRRLVGMVLLALAVAVTPQVVIALPALALALVWWCVGRPSGARKVLAAIASALASVAVFVLTLGATGLLFSLTVPETLQRYVDHASVNGFTAMWSYNLWGLLGPWQPDLHGDDVFQIVGSPPCT